MKNESPLVSILMLAYNHAPYIEQAMESCLSQETSFQFELVVCDDASTDGTTEIIKKWAEKHPNLIFLPQPVNGRGFNNCMDGLRHIRSKYIAFCEGDDYWITPHKLEKQIRFLEENPDFSVCCHRVEMQFDNRPNDKKKHYIYKDCNSEDERIKKGIFYADEAIASYYFQTSSFVFRWRFPDGLPPWFRKWMMLDHALMMLHAVEGKIKYFDEAMSIWRRNESGYSWLQNVDKGVFFQKEGYGWIWAYEEMDKFFSGRFHLQIRERILLALRGMVTNCIETGNVERLRKIIDDHQGWLLKPVKENAVLLDAVRLAHPEQVARVPPWAGKPEERGAAPETLLGGFMELDLQAVPEAPDSVWAQWTHGQESACFASPLAALVAWIYHRRVRRLWLPVIVPQLYVEELKNLGIPYQFYPVGGDFSPHVDFLRQTQPGDAVLTFSWLGRPPSQELRRSIIEQKQTLWIDDRTQALWPETSAEAHVTLYSPATVLGVPDGGILVGADVAALQPSSQAENTFAAQRRGLLLERLEQPTLDHAILTREQAIQQQAPLPGGAMSRLSAGLLARIPLRDVVSRRKNNWYMLHILLSEWALWPENVISDFAPFAFPLRLPESIAPAFVRTALVREKIISSSFWLALTEKYEEGLGDEAQLLRRLLCLPCDHRYDQNDMRRIAAAVRRIIQGESDFGAIGTRFAP